jgi:hypothetical protein
MVTDHPQALTDLQGIIEGLWHDHPDLYRDLLGVVEESQWHPTPQVFATFVARGLLPDLDADIRKLLAQHAVDLGTARVERVYDVRGWVVDSQPAVSISIASQLVHTQDLRTYVRSLNDVKAMIGLWVGDRTASLKGQIVAVTGTISQHRRRLLALTQRPEMQALITNAADDEPVVRVQVGWAARQYEYILSALRVIVRTEDFSRFHINPQRALKALRLSPEYRAMHVIKPIADLVKRQEWLTEGYNSKRTPGLFLTDADIGFIPRIRMGRNTIRHADDGTVLRHLRQCGLYKRAGAFQGGMPLRIGIIHAVGPVAIERFLEGLARNLHGVQFAVDYLHTERLQSISRADFEHALETFRGKQPHILLAFLPDNACGEEDEWSAYHHFKSLTISNDIAGQVVQQRTLENTYALDNITLGVLGKTGNIPFILAEPLEYADLVVGIDIARRRKERLAGSINATAIARIYFGNGEFLRYVIHDSPLEGETIPEHVLQSLFPSREFQGKRVVIHRDGYFRGEEKRALTAWAEKIGAVFFLVEVLKTGTPRLYASLQGRTQRPPKGRAFRLSTTEAFVVSSLPPFQDATPQPLHICTESPFTIEQALHSVLSLTLLHYGSLRSPRLPVTIHYSDRIAALALDGIKPKNLEGEIPFWL